MKHISRLSALAPPRCALVFPSRIPLVTRGLHTSPLSHQSDEKPSQRYKATIVEDNSPRQPSTAKSHPFFDEPNDSSASSSSQSRSDRLNRVADEVLSAEKRGARLKAQATSFKPNSRPTGGDAKTSSASDPGSGTAYADDIDWDLSENLKAEIPEDHTPVDTGRLILPPRKSWASETKQVSEQDADYVPAEDYAKLPAVGGLDNWFAQEGKWSRGIRPTGRKFFPPSVDAKKANKWKWSEVVKTALVDAVEATQGSARKMEVQNQMVAKGDGQRKWMMGVVLNDLTLKFEVSALKQRHTSAYKVKTLTAGRYASASSRKPASKCPTPSSQPSIRSLSCTTSSPAQTAR